MIRILLVDDHKIFRQGIASLLMSEESFEVVGEAGTGSAGVRLAAELAPDVILMDIGLPDFDGIEAARQIKKSNPKIAVILLTMIKNEHLFEVTSGIDIQGYLLKDDAYDDLRYAIRAVLKGEKYVSSSLNFDPFDSKTESPDSDISVLSKREKEIITLVAEGFTSREIADKLFVSIKTVETHRTNIMAKLGLKGLADMVRYAIKNGLVEA